MMSNLVIFEWCKKRFEYYEHKVDKTIHELWDDVKIMLSTKDLVKGDTNFFATFMFGQCKRHETSAWLIVLADKVGWFCADKKYLYHPIEGPLPVKDFTVVEYSSTGDSWKLI